MASKKVDRGGEAERHVHDFVARAFSADFVFRSPQRMDGRLEHEATDVFALFDDVAIAIEVKSQAYNADGSPRTEDAGWTRKNLQKAVSQLKGAARSIRTGNIVRLRNERRGLVQFSTGMFRFVYALAILDHVAASFDPLAVAPQIASAGVPLQVLSFADFYNIAHVLDTPVDLISYLEVRAQILCPRYKPHVHQEQAIFETYLRDFEELTSLHARLHGDDRPPTLFAENGDTLRKLYYQQSADIEPSYFIDRMIDRMHKVDESAPAPFENGTRDYLEIATYLSRLPRARRLIMGRAFVDAIKRASGKGADDFATFSSDRRSECILFLASHCARSERKQRNKDLYRLLWLLKATRRSTVAMGIVTEAQIGRGRSYDFVLLDGDPAEVTTRSDYEEIKRQGEALFGVAVPR